MCLFYSTEHRRIRKKAEMAQMVDKMSQLEVNKNEESHALQEEGVLDEKKTEKTKINPRKRTHKAIKESDSTMDSSSDGESRRQSPDKRQRLDKESNALRIHSSKRRKEKGKSREGRRLGKHLWDQNYHSCQYLLVPPTQEHQRPPHPTSKPNIDCMGRHRWGYQGAMMIKTSLNNSLGIHQSKHLRANIFKSCPNMVKCSPKQ